MRQFLTPNEIANQVRMLRTGFTGAILIVEGSTDARLFDRFIRKPTCVIVTAHSKENAVGAIRILDAQGFSGAIAVVDSDFWNLDGIRAPSSNVIVTDLHDIDTMILASDALERILGEFGQSDKMRRVGKPIRQALFEAGYPIGLFRWHSQKNRVYLKFEGIRFNKFFDTSTLTVDVGLLVQEVLSNSSNPGVAPRPTEALIQRLANGNPDPFQVCTGHDLVQIFTLSLNRNFGNMRGAAATDTIIDAVLRLAYTAGDFATTKLCASIRAWETRNVPRVVLV